MIVNERNFFTSVLPRWHYDSYEITGGDNSGYAVHWTWQQPRPPDIVERKVRLFVPHATRSSLACLQVYGTGIEREPTWIQYRLDKQVSRFEVERDVPITEAAIEFPDETVKCIGMRRTFLKTPMQWLGPGSQQALEAFLNEVTLAWLVDPSRITSVEWPPGQRR